MLPIPNVKHFSLSPNVWGNSGSFSNHSKSPLCDPDMAKSSKEFLRLSRVSLVMMSSIKNKVLDPAKRLLSFLNKSYR